MPLACEALMSTLLSLGLAEKKGGKKRGRRKEFSSSSSSSVCYESWTRKRKVCSPPLHFLFAFFAGKKVAKVEGVMIAAAAVQSIFLSSDEMLKKWQL